MAEMTLDEAFALASQLHQQGRLQEAEAGYRQIIAYAPNHADALNLLGVVTSQLGRADEGAEFIRQAIVLEPTSAHYRTNLAVALAQLGQHALAAGVEKFSKLFQVAALRAGKIDNRPGGKEQAEHGADAMKGRFEFRLS